MAPRPRPWFRFYVEAVHDRKLRRLKPEQRWLFVACLAAARQSPAPGFLLVGVDDPMGVEDLADFAGMTIAAVRVGMDALERVGVVELDGDEWSIPAWDSRQFESDSPTERVRKHRMEQASNGDVTADVTAPETEAETETETPPSPPATITAAAVVEEVFRKVLADSTRTGRPIRSVDGFRNHWDSEEGTGALIRAAQILDQYDMPTLSHYADATRSPTTPPWAASMKRTTGKVRHA